MSVHFFEKCIYAVCMQGVQGRYCMLRIACICSAIQQLHTLLYTQYAYDYIVNVAMEMGSVQLCFKQHIVT